jgi:predicted deacylase
MKRLGLNHNAYAGETIDIDRVLGEAAAAATDHGWSIDRIPLASGQQLLVFHRDSPAAPHNIYLSTGIHGDEPAGPLALGRLLREDGWPANARLWICPCLNPGGFRLNRRESEDGIDLNRDYRHRRTPEVRAHVAWLEQRPSFDLCLCLHEDWESHGFYVYELNPDNRPSLAEKMVEAAERVCPIDRSPVIEGREARDGIIRPKLDPAARPEWPEAFYLIEHKTRLSYTLEAPSDFPLATRVAALVEATRAALAACG